MQIYQHNQPVQLEQGGLLPKVQIAYHTYGELNEAKDNVVWVCHALTANSDAVDWWPNVIGGAAGKITPDNHFIVCANVLGSCYGTTNPRAINPQTGEVYALDFPRFTVRDVVKLHDLLRIYLGVNKIALCIGGSFGGHQVLEYAAMYPDVIDSILVLATSAKETAWSVAIHESQRMALETDVTFDKNDEKAGATGLKTARAIGLISYRTIDAYIQTQADDDDQKLDDFRASSYVRYQGDKLEKRFHAHNYWYLTKCLDSHNLGRNRGGIESALQQINQPATVIGIDTDMLIPTREQKFLAKNLPNANYYEISSNFGHDGFLIEHNEINYYISKHLAMIGL